MNLAIWYPAMFVLGVVAMGTLPRCSSMPAKRSEEIRMLILTAAVSAFLFIYLFTALIRPEWF